MGPPPLPTPSPAASDEVLEIPYALADAEIRDADPLWLHRVFLGTTGIAAAMAMFVVIGTFRLIGNISRSPTFAFDYTWSRLGEVAYGMEWFSALYLLASHEVIGGHDEGRRRRLLLYIGSAAVILHYAPLHLLSIRRSSNVFVDSLLSLISVAGASVLLLYILRLAQRTGDPFLRRHTPAAVMLVFINFALEFGFSIRGSFVGANDVTMLLNVVSHAYLCYVLLHMRRVFGNVVASIKSSLVQTQHTA